MDLNQILQKTKKRAESINVSRAAPSIAITDRPYEAEARPLRKSRTNREQTGNKPGTKWGQNREQTGNKVGTVEKAITSNREQTGNKVGSEPGTLSGTKREQTGNKTNPVPFYGLVGLQRNIILIIHQVSKLNRSDVTGPLSLETIATHIGNTSLDSVKTSLKRLEAKKCIYRIAYKTGRGGWSTYKLAATLFQEISQQEAEGKLLQVAGKNEALAVRNREQTGNKVGSEPGTRLLSSSSYDLNHKNTTTTYELAPEYEEINFEALVDIGFTRSHLLQIVKRTSLVPQLIQDSIDAFAFDLETNNKKQTFQKAPLDVFMGILGKGLVYNAPENFETPQQANMKLYFEQKRAELEKNRQLEEEALFIAFEEWKAVTANQSLIKDVIAGLDPMIRQNEKVVAGHLYSYYKENVWFSVRESFLEKIK